MTNQQPVRRGFATNLRVALAAFVCCCLFPCAFAQTIAKKEFNIPAGDAKQALKQFAAQTNEQLLAADIATAGVKTNPVSGEMTPAEALDRMLADTGLKADYDAKTRSFAVRKETEAERKNVNRALAQTSDRPGQNDQSQTSENGEKIVKLETFEVMGTKLLNMDKPRSASDPQPYVVFDRSKIEQSGAINLGDFLKTRLTMNTTAGDTGTQSASSAENKSYINLRGLGSNQTTILLDGHRMSGALNNPSTAQPDINAIPMSAVERIDILPTSASGIYGGGATGGVINIILRRDYQGGQIKLTYDNTFDTDSAIRSVDLSTGFVLEGGKTQVLVAGHYSDSNALLVKDRDFARRGRALLFANNPASILNASTPPLGYTPNIRNSTLATLVLKNGLALPSNITFVPPGYSGVSDGGTALIANAGKYNLDIAESINGAGNQSLRNDPQVKALYASINRKFSPHVQAFLDFSASSNIQHNYTSIVPTSITLPATAPNNPFTTPIVISFASPTTVQGVYGQTVDLRAVGGVIVELPGRWKSEADYTWDRSRLKYKTIGSGINNQGSTALNSGVIDVVRDVNLYPPDFSTFIVGPTIQEPGNDIATEASLRVGGPLLTIPAGDLTLTGLLQRSTEDMGSRLNVRPSTTAGGASNYTFSPSLSQAVDSVYVEFWVPLVAPALSLPFVKSLDLQLAARHASYSTTGAEAVRSSSNPPIFPSVSRGANKVKSTDPTIALRWKPIDDMVLRGSYATGYLPPSVSQITPPLIFPNSLGLFGLTDPRRGNEAITSGDYISGGNANLKPEESTSWSAGVIVTVKSLPEFRMSIDWSRINKRNNIFIPNTLNQAGIAQESSVPTVVTRANSAPGDPFGVGRILSYNEIYTNLLRATVEAYDIQIEYDIKTHAAGDFELALLATRQTHYQVQTAASAPLVENVGFNQGFGGIPLKLKGNFSVTWKYRRWTAGCTARYYSSYHPYNATASTASQATTILNQGSDHIAAQLYFDTFATYQLGTHGARSFRQGLFADTEITLGVKNAFNREPPPIADVTGQTYSYIADPRLASYWLSIKKNF